MKGPVVHQEGSLLTRNFPLQIEKLGKYWPAIGKVVEDDC